MRKFEAGDIVYYNKKKLKCIIKECYSNSVFEKTYVIVSLDNSNYPGFKVKGDSIQIYKEYIRNKKIEEILND